MKIKQLLILSTAALSLAACGEHTHSFGEAWKSDDTSHWHECECGEKSDKADHLDTNKDGKCDVCDHDMEVPSPSGEKYNVHLSCEPITGGTVLGAGEYSENANVTITAEPASGYNFLGWYEGEALKSMDSSYTFTMPSNNVSFTAKFSSSTYTLTIIYDSSKGTVSHCNDADPSDHGPYNPMTCVRIVASPLFGASFDGFYDENDNIITDSVMCMCIIFDHDVTIYAKFE